MTPERGVREWPYMQPSQVEWIRNRASSKIATGWVHIGQCLPECRGCGRLQEFAELTITCHDQRHYENRSGKAPLSGLGPLVTYESPDWVLR